MFVTTIDGAEHDLSDYYFAGIMDGQIMFNFKVPTEVHENGRVKHEGLSFALDEVEEVTVND